MKWQNIPVAFPLFIHFIKLEIEPIKLIKDKFFCIQVTEESVGKYNRQLNQPMNCPPKRNVVYKGIDDLTVKQFIKKLYAPLPTQIKRYVISLIPPKLKTKIKQFLFHSLGR